MFTIGEFSKIARVSKRLLRYYDEIDLFKPDTVDSVTGYRRYTSSQLPKLNSILALKDMLLSLDEIKAVVSSRFTATEMSVLLEAKKQIIEEKLITQQKALESIESRIQAVKGIQPPGDVELKAIPSQKYVHVREICKTPADGRAVAISMYDCMAEYRLSGSLIFIGQNEGFELENNDVKVGFVVDDTFDKSINTVVNGHQTVLVAELLKPVTVATTRVALTICTWGTQNLPHGSTKIATACLANSEK
jgi:DNA-binding transcriptional MerR regulator